MASNRQLRDRIFELEAELSRRPLKVYTCIRAFSTGTRRFGLGDQILEVDPDYHNRESFFEFSHIHRGN